MTCRKEISDDLNIIADKHSTNHIPASPSFPTSKPGESATRDVTHGFMNFTFTRALCKNVTKKMRKLNVEMQLFQDLNEDEVTYDLYFHKYISELCLNIEPCDVVVHIPAVRTVLNCFDIRPNHQKPQSKDKSKKDLEASETSTTETKETFPFFTSSTIPLLYITVGTLRFFIPCVKDETESIISRERSVVSTVDNDLIVAMVHSVSVEPQAENPLPRYAVEKDLYHRALQLGLAQQPGSAVENRQYQVDIKGMTVCSGMLTFFTHIKAF